MKSGCTGLNFESWHMAGPLKDSINLHSFVHITTFKSLWGYISPHPALKKSSTPVLSFSVQCLASCCTMMPYKLFEQCKRPGTKSKVCFFLGQGPSMRPGANKKRPSWVPQRLHHLKNLKNKTPNLLENLSAGQWDFHKITQKKNKYLQLHLSVFQEVVEQWQYLRVFLLWQTPSNTNPQTATQQPPIAASMVFSIMPQSEDEPALHMWEWSLSKYTACVVLHDRLRGLSAILTSAGLHYASRSAICAQTWHSTH